MLIMAKLSLGRILEKVPVLIHRAAPTKKLCGGIVDMLSSYHIDIIIINTNNMHFIT